MLRKRIRITKDDSKMFWGRPTELMVVPFSKMENFGSGAGLNGKTWSFIMGKCEIPIA